MTQYYVRKDGADSTRFICAAERDVFEKGRSHGAIKKSLRAQAQLQVGAVYACVSKSPDERIHSVLSREYGYSLGECVLAHLHRLKLATTNVIWCEEVDGDTGECLLVIIVNGAVEHDSRIPPSTLDKHATLILEQARVQFTVLVHGETPIAPPDSTDQGIGKIRLKSDLIDVFTVLENPSFPHVDALSRFEFVSIAKAFDHAGLTRRWAVWVWPVFVISLVVYGWTAFVDPAPMAVAPTAAVIIDNYSDYKTIMKSPSPATQITQVHAYLRDLNAVPGVIVQRAEMTGDALTVHLHPIDDVVMQLTDQLEKWGWKSALSEGNIVISRTMNSIIREEPTHIMPLQPVLESLLDSAFVAGIDVEIDAIQSNGHHQSTQMTLSFTNNSSLLHEFISIMLEGMPVVLTQLSIKQYSITQQRSVVSFTVYGASDA